MKALNFSTPGAVDPAFLPFGAAKRGFGTVLKSFVVWLLRGGGGKCEAEGGGLEAGFLKL